ncbi:MAG: hypothetical protein GXY77_12255 [Fibrobacter sp.]|nr:hypothetical protein [Fibrobacter sp.]
MASIQNLNRIREELIESGKDDRYKIGGYDFVLNGLEFYLAKIGEKRHVSGHELSLGLLLFAQKQFGPLAEKVLEYWRIKKSDDFGNIVYNLISIGIMSKKPEDKIEDFYDVVSFQDYFERQENFDIDPEFIKRIKGA